MTSISNIFGASAKIFLQYDGDIEVLADTLSKGLLIPDFYFKSDQDPPHELQGLCETLGYEIWLTYTKEYPGFAFELMIETELQLEESFNHQFYNISPWFARHVSTVCHLISCTVNIDGKILYFKNGEIYS